MSASAIGPIESNLFKVPERMVLEGYRYWVVGIASKQRPNLKNIKRLYSNHLPEEFVEPALMALVHFIGALGFCSNCPLKTFRVGSGNLCQDEAMVLALVAALQQGDEDAAEPCLESLSCKTPCYEVANAAGQLACILKGADLILLPIPHSVLHNIIAVNRANQLRNGLEHNSSSPTLH